MISSITRVKANAVRSSERKRQRTGGVRVGRERGVAHRGVGGRCRRDAPRVVSVRRRASRRRASGPQPLRRRASRSPRKPPEPMAFRDPRLRAGRWLPTVPRVTRLVGLLLFLVFSEDSGAAYRTQLGAPLAWVYNALLDPTPIKLRPFDLIMLAILLVASLKKKRGA